MKKIFVTLVALVAFGFSANARTASTCEVRGAPNACIEVRVEFTGTGSSGHQTMTIRASGTNLRSGTAQVVVNYTRPDESQGRAEGIVRLQNNRQDGRFNFNMRSGSTITSVVITNAQGQSIR